MERLNELRNRNRTLLSWLGIAAIVHASLLLMIEHPNFWAVGAIVWLPAWIGGLLVQWRQRALDAAAAKGPKLVSRNIRRGNWTGHTTELIMPGKVVSDDR
jgi:hypothetical protein